AAAATRWRKLRRETTAGWLVMSFSSKRPEVISAASTAARSCPGCRTDRACRPARPPHPRPSWCGRRTGTTPWPPAPPTTQPPRLVVAGRQDALAVGREDGPMHLLRVPLQLPLLAGAQLEDAQHVVHAAGQNELAVRRERHAGDPRCFDRERAEGAVPSQRYA